MSQTQHYADEYSKRKTPQSEQIENTVANSAGGFSYAINKWQQLDRFLILGTTGGTYYIGQRELTVANAKAVEECIVEDGIRTVQRIVEISNAGRASNNDPALFALALCAAAKEVVTRRAALTMLPQVARIPTHLFHFATFVKAQRGWGRLLKEAIANWYNNKSIDTLAYHSVKYKQRDGWSNRDLLRLSHPKTNDEVRKAIYEYIVSGKISAYSPSVLHSTVMAQTYTDLVEHSKILASLILRNNLPREAIPTEMLNSVEVWEALLEKMPMTAMIRNLGKMSSIKLLKPFTDATKLVVERLQDQERLRKARIHPLQILSALRTYESGHGLKGSLSWSVEQSISNALDDAFYSTFETVEPTGKNYLLALDVSSSMSWGKLSGFTPMEGAAAMAMITNAVEDNVHTVYFSDRGQVAPFTLKTGAKLTDTVQRLHDLPWGGTDCAAPMLYAMERNIENIDVFVVYTDSETWAGVIHPSQTLQEYRNKFNPKAKLVVVGMTSNEFSIADPNDAGMLDVVGFDTNTPAAINNFIME